MQAGVGLLDTDVMPMFMIIALDVIIFMRFSINCSALICSPTIIYMLSREKPLVKPMAPGSLFHIIESRLHLTNFRSIIMQSLLSNLYIKNTKNITLLSLSDLTFASDREGIDNPFIALVARFLIVCAGIR